MFGNFRNINIGGNCNEFLKTTKELQQIFYEISILKEEEIKNSNKFESYSQTFIKVLRMEFRLALSKVKIKNSEEIISDVEKIFRFFIDKFSDNFNRDTFDKLTKLLEEKYDLNLCSTNLGVELKSIFLIRNDIKKTKEEINRIIKTLNQLSSELREFIISKKFHLIRKNTYYIQSIFSRLFFMINNFIEINNKEILSIFTRIYEELEKFNNLNSKLSDEEIQQIINLIEKNVLEILETKTVVIEETELKFIIYDSCFQEMLNINLINE